ncbi:AzlD domain-containing protein [Aureimonas altamirensis]|uniref:AzlD family protein n=1 Tax=Aureimonas altamirensis TaxID=370622 RepID=UPI002037530B|nr:AzlD domain-containing protein [Aureimonas altamirensis]MCM2503701.1 AzlD domain-containing protein [Aureimonas altamirensis]
MSGIWLLVLLAAVTTYATRVGGYLVLQRMGRISPRLDAILNAVPAAVLPTIFVPAFVDGGWVERCVLVLCGLLAVRLSLLSTVAIGTAIVIVARLAGL